MFDFIGGIVSGIGRAVGGVFRGESGFPSFTLPSLPRQVVQIFRDPELDPEDDPAGPTVAQIIQERSFRDVGIPSVNQVTPGLDVFEGQTGIVNLGDTFDPTDPGPATFEPDPLRAEPDTGTAEEVETVEAVPIHSRIISAIAGLIPPIAAGTAIGVGTSIGEAVGSAVGGTAVAPPEPATTPSGFGFDNFLADPGGSSMPGMNGRPPTIAQVRGMILSQIGAQHGRRSFSYNTARRILRDLGEEAGARCLGITAGQACFLLIHPPKRRGRQITPKQINRAMGAYKRVRALNKSVRKTLGPGCKL